MRGSTVYTGGEEWRLAEVCEGGTVRGQRRQKATHLGKLLNSVCAEGMDGDTDGKGGRVSDGA